MQPVHITAGFYLPRPAGIAAARQHQHARSARACRQLLEHPSLALPHARFQHDHAATRWLGAVGLWIIGPPQGAHHEDCALQQLLHEVHEQSHHGGVAAN